MDPREYMSPGPSGLQQQKILGRNNNGTLVLTSAPGNEAELQLYRVMQRASLLAYYDTLLEMGGDDVQQLCDAGEEEFLEIMALVGMASKPLHVRRLQKALQEWLSNPALFQTPLVPGFPGAVPVPVTGAVPVTAAVAVAAPLQNHHPHPHPHPHHHHHHHHLHHTASSTQPQPPQAHQQQQPQAAHHGLSSPAAATATAAGATPAAATSPASSTSTPVPAPTATTGVTLVPSAALLAAGALPTTATGPTAAADHSPHSVSSVACGLPSPGRQGSDSTSPVRQAPSPPGCPGSGSGAGSPLQVTPVLLEAQVSRLAEAADALVRSLPHLEPRHHNPKKKVCKDLEHVLSMAEDDPRRMEEIRKYAAIYGRFDCKRKPEKPLTLHEVSVNEAAAQICRYMPALLTRRDELFPLARQVVRDSGYHYSKGHSNLSACLRPHSGRTSNGDENHSSKRPRLSPSPADLSDHDSQGRLRRQERLEQIADELRSLAERSEELVAAAQQVRDTGSEDHVALRSLQQQLELVQNRQTQLLAEQGELSARHQHNSFRSFRSRSGKGSSCFDSERPDTDDTDSQFSFSNVSSPSQEVSDSRDSSVREIEGTGGTEIKTEKNPCKISKQMVNETLMDEGLRVVKEMVANQNKESVNTQSTNFEDPYQESKVQVIASSGGNIIAVANPALSMSPAIAADAAEGALLRGPLIPLLTQEHQSAISTVTPEKIT
ncbi:NGFI-A-binding protein homolog [Schistocerca serialis cubense]|uniref:NGFI-A-binding protein homolog n=1 Tax=Schistocerca serialis cubense TaxID=2023355 RepID=UPI00214E462B|nr:NGFI-A-binding protein homolog [Schistocerca serialis cubense]